MAGPLQGIRIVDATSMIAGPLATMILGDQGADVIKIENPAGGDHSRQVAGRRNGWSASFLQNNRSKRSVALDLKHDAGLEALRAILKTADVFVQNWRPGVAERLGLSEAAVRELRPDIVYVSIAGFGFEGDWAERPVYDPLIQALSGLAAVQGQGRGRPSLVRTIVPDKVTAIQASQAITAALLARARTGRGEHVRLSMLDTIVAFLFASDFTGQTFIGDEAEEETWEEDGRAQDYVELIYETADGFMAVSAHTDATWRGLSKAVGRPDWLEDERFATVEAREVNKAARLVLTQEALRDDRTANWMERLRAEDVPCAPVLRRSEMVDHPQVEANGTILRMDHPGAGSIRLARPPARFEVHSPDPPRPALALGADTRAVLAEAGFGEDAIAAIFASGAAAEKESDK
ncbi:crotonobetainyl-CoA:carnitine CoA-transferase CaiB-like acyl-CoA transferase [Palleronia aestuarii]|uniref:Crotonobetainyl-CoA:carnitine CoA-transferase CaiB-like acyl-CoA transferase n=1 Tax=Palleronia aestuarii TaxID=568105 RepID=A0A2W7N6A0_9RHOB|nr:CoA transferase [Palleronia aestuarii]PZX12384.1 crotonobetainyl-CoA:carnitine CoA-transferase CaiB-like acyl-CoA transferase [Palleronia aestuarii]